MPFQNLTIPSLYQEQTDRLYEYNQTLYELSGIGIFFVVLRSFRVISNILLGFMFPLKLMLLQRQTYNLYYYCGLVLFTYQRFGTEGTQIPYAVDGSTNGRYYYLFGENSPIKVNSYYLGTGNYTTVLFHDADFTLLWLLLLSLLSGLGLKSDYAWAKSGRSLLIQFLDGSVFELSLLSTAQLYQTKSNTEIGNIIFSVCAGLLMILLFLYIQRPLLKILYQQDYLLLDSQVRQIYGYQIELYNQFVIGIVVPFLAQNQFQFVLFSQLGLHSILLFVLAAPLRDQAVSLSLALPPTINLLYAVSYCLLIVGNYSDQPSDYQYSFVVTIILSLNILLGLFNYAYTHTFAQNQTIVQNAIQDGDKNETQLELQQIMLDQNSSQRDSTQQHLDSPKAPPRSKSILASQFNSQPSSIQFNTNQNQFQIFVPKRKAFELSELYDQGLIKLFRDDIVCQFKFLIVVLNNNHEVDPKFLKRNTFGTRIKGIHIFTIINQSLLPFTIKHFYLKVYFAEKLVYRELKLMNQHIGTGQEIEVRQELYQESSDDPNDKLAIKIEFESDQGFNQLPIRFNICNNELKLIRVEGCSKKILQKLQTNNLVNQYQILFESTSEQYNYKRVQDYCMHYNFLFFNIDSPEAQYRNQQLSSRFGKIQMILPSAPYIKLLLIIEVQINREMIDSGLVDTLQDLQRPQYIMASIFAKKKHTQLSQSHKSISAAYGGKLIEYFRTQ